MLYHVVYPLASSWRQLCFGAVLDPGSALPAEGSSAAAGHVGSPLDMLTLSRAHKLPMPAKG